MKAAGGSNLLSANSYVKIDENPDNRLL